MKKILKQLLENNKKSVKLLEKLLEESTITPKKPKKKLVIRKSQEPRARQWKST
jgi:hypothetical protein